MTTCSEVAIVGAGPYGLSLAAYLQARGIDFRIFGSPMYSWRVEMPAGMFLKSEGFASSLYEPTGCCTLQRFCEENGRVYRDYGVPVARETFTAYGLDFQRRLVPVLEEKAVVALDRLSDEFVLKLEDGESVMARQVVVAVGATYYRHVPQSLAGLPSDLLTHSADHHDLSRFKGRDVTVIGGGASALDLAASLDEIGADVRLVARRPKLQWNAPMDRPLRKRFYPMSGLGGGWRNRFYENAPMLFRHLPQEKRLQIVRSWLGPSGAWPIKDRILSRVPLILGRTPEYTEVRGDRAFLRVVSSDGEQSDFLTDHIIAATGYRVDLRRLPFLSDGLRSRLRSAENAPILSAEFQSSVPRLYFVGLTAANSFGPVMRFVLGARFTARRLSARLAGAASKGSGRR